MSRILPRFLQIPLFVPAILGMTLHALPKGTMRNYPSDPSLGGMLVRYYHPSTSPER